ncbi:hypothetical protein A3H65_03440 [Candidatus Giovannonibacteria bacterium RIFCSPLOWO2_02_FULL_45_14]|uniref:Phosphotyrosine protein phosphatase I domain-containing protein n=1 Tax=Candidatus Giovannonibacteria bacterium RIFCSPLOWO2_12_FULL_44_15 TaxID=1798364 RepID=A0A1F5Y044_9BACT|nr:MAG: hypothetical protein A3C75_01745 [Candidatus Giovannonibacteria bacterium RIFCSPHIGHO2_02_FULL_44_31]OGF90690.1 MAG: hypothetical protein A3H65_03440 [Candidatus Giovannonibacteria bacterium RIFCSPLOWO2_02_FULL_45_14]OGF93548.1 MAG: hypothetical protein A3G54_01225 [Candidatus Giovannonibacteria bacterium RIFCSPLOWO2_12_FULL_44_15]
MYTINMKILFICKGNMFRSQMAAAIYNKMTNNHDAISAGTYVGAPDEPEGRLIQDLFPANDPVQEILEENGMTIRENHTTKLTPKMLDEADIVVSMAEEPFIPEFLKKNKKVIWWDIANPDNATPEFVEETYKKLSVLVRELVEKQKIPSGDHLG